MRYEASTKSPTATTFIIPERLLCSLLLHTRHLPSFHTGTSRFENPTLILSRATAASTTLELVSSIEEMAPLMHLSFDERDRI